MRRRPYRNGPCKNCGVERWTLHRDHIVPRYKGGSDDESNVQYLCANCHEDKSREDLKGNNRGRKLSEEHKAAIRRANLGSKRSPEACKKIGDANRKRAGKFHHSEETKERIAMSNVIAWRTRR